MVSRIGMQLLMAQADALIAAQGLSDQIRIEYRDPDEPVPLPVIERAEYFNHLRREVERTNAKMHMAAAEAKRQRKAAKRRAIAERTTT